MTTPTTLLQILPPVDLDRLQAYVRGLEANDRRYRWVEANAKVEVRGWIYWHDDDECTPLSERVDAAIAATAKDEI